MDLKVGEYISEELRSYIEIAWRDRDFKDELEEKSGYKESRIRQIINGNARIDENNIEIIITATRLAIKKYNDNSVLLKVYADKLKKLKVINTLKSA